MQKISIGIIVGAAAVVGIAKLLSIIIGSATFDILVRDGTVVAALLTALASLLVSQRMYFEQRRMRQAGTDPVVIVHLTKREDAPSMIMLSLTNVGAGAALNVTVEPQSELEEPFKKRVITDPKLVKHPIGVIPNNSSVDYHFGAGHQLLGDQPIPPFDVLVRYRDIDGVEHKRLMNIDVRGLEHQGVYKPSTSRIADSLEKIEKHARARLTAPMNVISETRAENRTRLEAEKKEFLAKIARKEGK